MDLTYEAYNLFVNLLPDFVFNDILVPVWQLAFPPNGSTIQAFAVSFLFRFPFVLFFINRISRLIKRLY